MQKRSRQLERGERDRQPRRRTSRWRRARPRLYSRPFAPRRREAAQRRLRGPAPIRVSSRSSTHSRLCMAEERRDVRKCIRADRVDSDEASKSAAVSTVETQRRRTAWRRPSIEGTTRTCRGRARRAFWPIGASRRPRSSRQAARADRARPAGRGSRASERANEARSAEGQRAGGRGRRE